jgi:hypothetical protein
MIRSVSIVVIIYLFLLFKIHYNKKNKLLVINDYDIIYNQGGYYGFYQLGICHYIKNNFDISKKKTLGISAGSWISLFMLLDKKNSNLFIKKLFSKIHYTYPISKLFNLFEQTLYECDNVNLKYDSVNIMVSNLNNFTLDIHNNFVSLKDLLNCCKASSFIPLISYKDIFYFYKNKLVYDGGLLKRYYFKNINPNSLELKFDMFGRFKKNKTYKALIKPGRSLYDLYILGYKDAQNNHKMLKKYF